MYVIFLLTMAIYLVMKAQITLLIAKKVQILAKYLDFSEIFLKKKALMLLKTINLNQYIIEFQENQQPSYRSIYNLGTVKLELLKTYIKNNLAIDFIWPLNLPAGAFIFFVLNLNSNL